MGRRVTGSRVCVSMQFAFLPVCPAEKGAVLVTAGYIVYPAATSACIHGPRSVSIPTSRSSIVQRSPICGGSAAGDGPISPRRTGLGGCGGGRRVSGRSAGGMP
ncbi:hypothetical protein Acsp02_42170 [Actinoplanes sp. NBRC 103695]|nr:hypothetical protein Acsp02_42170 [Actinoplanes sp. NBRC 103695]